MAQFENGASSTRAALNRLTPLMFAWVAHAGLPQEDPKAGAILGSKRSDLVDVAEGAPNGE